MNDEISDKKNKEEVVKEELDYLIFKAEGLIDELRGLIRNAESSIEEMNNFMPLKFQRRF